MTAVQEMRVEGFKLHQSSRGIPCTVTPGDGTSITVVVDEIQPLAEPVPIPAEDTEATVIVNVLKSELLLQAAVDSVTAFTPVDTVTDVGSYYVEKPVHNPTDVIYRFVCTARK